MERVKKIILMAAAFAVVVGMTFINNNVAYADNAKTVNIHYHRRYCKSKTQKGRIPFLLLFNPTHFEHGLLLRA